MNPDTSLSGLLIGLPIGAVLSRELATGFQPGDHGTTYGGSPAVCAGALAVLDAVEDEDLIGNAQRIGERLERSLVALDGVAAVRGAGLLRAVELAGGDAAGAATALRAEGVLVNAVTETALRIAPPLVIDEAQADLFLAALGRILAARG